MTASDVKEFVEVQKKLMLSDDCTDLSYQLIAKLFNEKKGIDTFKAIKVFGKTIVSYFDLITNVLVFIEFLSRRATIAILQGVSLGFSLVLQIMMSIVIGQPMLAALSGLIGLKPVIEAWRDAKDAKPYPKQN